MELFSLSYHNSCKLHKSVNTILVNPFSYNTLWLMFSSMKEKGYNCTVLSQLWINCSSVMKLFNEMFFPPRCFSQIGCSSTLIAHGYLKVCHSDVLSSSKEEYPLIPHSHVIPSIFLVEFEHCKSKSVYRTLYFVQIHTMFCIWCHIGTI